MSTGLPGLPAHGPFALLHRPGSGDPTMVDVLAGPMRHADRLADLDLDGRAARAADGPAALAVLPYRQIAERGYPAPEDGTPLALMDVHTHHRVPVDQVLTALPHRVPPLDGLAFDLNDLDYGRLVRRVQRTEIEAGEGSNFVLSRSLRGRFRTFDRDAALAVFRGLLADECGAYWTFLVHTGDRYLIGSPPELHVGVRGDEVAMNPISGTYRLRGDGEDRQGLLDFLHDPKEIDELYMVVDEELKMMAALCDRDLVARGPSLTWMTHVAHTGYHLTGRCTRTLADVLRGSMFAPTVTGSPMRNACRAIAQHEPRGRGYYAGAIALVGAERGRRALDSSILIRTADIATDGAVRLTAGATIVRHSDPEGEAAETAAKAAGMLRAMTGGRRADQVEVPMDDAVVRALHQRNVGVSRFWRSAAEQHVAEPALRGLSVTVVDAEDDFSAMLAYQLRALGCAVRIQPWRLASTDDDVLVLGPGPGAPDDRDNPKMAVLRELAADALLRHRPLIAVCLGHQIVCDLLGLPLIQLPRSNQGRRARVRLHGREQWLGFYNSYAAGPAPVTTAEITRDSDGHVLALTAPGLATAQFHAESFLTEDSPRILRALLRDALTSPVKGEQVHA